MRYREEQDLVIRNVTFSVAPGSKCAIIGRTASGKSSLFNCLLRFQEIENDNNNSGIYLNGTDVRDLSLHALRTSISFIPQSPVLFLGTLRENLDFNNSNSDEEIWSAIEQVGLSELLERKVCKESQSMPNIKEILDYSISENGSNFSCGEKQLICLARSILKKSKLLLMDEATANVDSFTDSQIQKTLRGPLFNNCTIITIAHRIETVKDYDRIILMKLGEIEMNDTPSQVLQYYVENYNQ
ncbi:predicted protein [Naegleria gruberi]|uniref:Predicted protein n=1 Tax=Naegleria gruberi TaxID=5762 RepID=D2VXP6_NAEGR|nr:uncharacterized protein NAEGRDRAFT_60934 [Naegleria gruberi]EFC38328.1 predicted protein [Naegleria gruberi]|eukprot:XP_002671072.1 predicted protein [Naegleria gruberi strain NEG-M]